jgi:hypothetical protein
MVFFIVSYRFILHVKATFYVDCEKVLNICGNVLTKYKRTVSLYTPRSEEEEEKTNKKMYYQVEFNQNNFRFKYLAQTNRIKESVPYYRQCIEYEFTESGNKVLSLIEYGGKWNSNDITPKRAAKLSNKQIMEMIQVLIMSDAVTPEYTEEMQRQNSLFTLKSCENCGKTERTMEEYMGCARCGKACQKKNWSTHKRDCIKEK